MFINLRFIVAFSNQMKKFDDRIKKFLRRKMYYHKNVKDNTNHGKKPMKIIFIYKKTKYLY